MIRVAYFALLRQQAGCDAEQVDAAGSTPRQLYASVRARHGFTMDPAQLRVAVDGAFASWDCVLGEGAEVVFIPPVSGG